MVALPKFIAVWLFGLFFSIQLMAANTPDQSIVIFYEDFDGSRLQEAIDEFDPNPGIVDWSTPENSGTGWKRGADDVVGGTAEWLGWSFTTTQFWIGNDNQNRSDIYPSSISQIVAVADSDEAEDGGSTPKDGYNAFLRTPTIDISAFDINSIQLTFDSNFRSEEDETSKVNFIFDNGSPISVNIPDQALKLENMSFNLHELPGVPIMAHSLVVEFAHEKADNNWWWVIDNVKLIGDRSTTRPINSAPVVSLSAIGPLLAEVGKRLTYSFSAADVEQDRVQICIDWGDGNQTQSSLMNDSEDISLDHTWELPGAFDVRARAFDEMGGDSDWSIVGTVVVDGNLDNILLTPPYLQNVSTNSIVVMCETQFDIGLSIDYGVDDSLDLSASLTSTASGGGTWFQRILLDNLEPGTTYNYLISVADGDPLSERATFKTAPLGSPDIRFSVWSDSQGHNRGAWRQEPLEPTISMMKHMVSSDVDFGLTTGDLAEDGGSYSDTRQYYLDRVARHLGRYVPWFAAWGNHDTGDQNSPLRLASDMPSRYRTGFSSGHGSYTFTYANCFFVCMDHFQQSDITSGWLESQLSSEVAQNARFRFVGIHVPPYCERWIDGSATLRNNLVPLLEQYNVDFCFSGHTHEYERGEKNHVHYVITGGGSWLDHSEPIVRDWEHMFVGGVHDVPGFWAEQSRTGVLGAPKPIVGGLFNEYALITIREKYLKMETHGFNADGSEIGVLDTLEIGEDPGPDSDGDGMRDQWELANGLNPNDDTGVNGARGDLDEDGAINLHEMFAGRDPNSAVSLFSIKDLKRQGNKIEVTWASQPGKEYLIDTAINFSSWVAVMDRRVPVVIPGDVNAATTTYSFNTLPNDTRFVRVRIK